VSALVVGLVTDVLADGPAGLGVMLAALAIAAGLGVSTSPRPTSVAFLVTGVVFASFAVLRASPLLVGLDLAASACAFAMAGAFAREGDPLRTGLRAYLTRLLTWLAAVLPALRFLVGPLRRLWPTGRPRSWAIPRAVALSLTVGLAFVLLLGSADAVFAELLRAPLRGVPFDRLPRHVVVVAGAGTAFVTLAVRSSRPVSPPGPWRPFEGGWLRPAEWISLLATVDTVFALFVGVQLYAFFGGRLHVLSETGLTFAEYARSGFWQMMAASTLTGLVIAAAWIGGRPTGHDRAWFIGCATLLVSLSLVVLASAFQRLVLYETEFGYTWPRLIPHATILFLGVLLAFGLVAIVSGRTAWLPTAGIALAFCTLGGLNALDPEAFIADRNIARAERGYEVDPWELTSLSADAVTPIAASLDGLEPDVRAIVARDLACLRRELREQVARHGWGSYNASRAEALERLAPMTLPAC